MTTALPRIALQVWIVLFIVFFGAEVVHLEPGLRVITQVLYGVPLAAWALLRLRGPADRLDWAVLGLLGVYGAVALVGRDRTESLGTLALATAYAAWFLLLRREQHLRVRSVMAIATGLTLTLVFNAFLAIREKVDWYAAVGAAPLEGVVTFPWETVNALPVLVLLTAPFIARLERGPIRTVLAGVAILSAIVLVPISNGRAGYLGLAIAALVAAALHPKTGDFVRRMDRGGRVAVGLGIGLVAAVALAVIGPRFVDALGTSGRLLIWKQGINMIGASPLTGTGPGVYSWARLEFPPMGADLLAVRLPHSVPLLTAVEGGLVLVVAVLVAIAVWVATAAPERREWAASDRMAVAALVGFAAASFMDDFSFLPAVTAAVLALAAFLVPIAHAPHSRGWVMPALLALAATVALPSVLSVDVARWAAQDGRTSMVRGAYTDAVRAFEAATEAHPENGGYWLGLGMARAWAGSRSGAISTTDRAAATSAYERAIDATPGDPRAYAALAPLDLDTDAVPLLAAAADRTLGDPQYALRLGAALASAGRVDEATHAWGRALALQPELIRRIPFAIVNVPIGRLVSEAALIIVTEPGPAPEADLAKIWDLALLLNDVPSDAGLQWRAVDAARHGDTESAQELADLAIAEVRYDARGYQAAAAVAAFACDLDGEQRAIDLEEATRHGWAPFQPEPQSRREFVFREASLGPTQPPNVTGPLEIDRWPWSLIDRPACDS